VRIILKIVFLSLFIICFLYLSIRYANQELIAKYYETTTRSQQQIQHNIQDRQRFIAHAGGAIDGHTYTNSLEALNLNYARGYRLFELDIIKTADNIYVAAHDWQGWKNETGFTGKLPPTRDTFKQYKVRGRFTPLDLADINNWFIQHSDAILVTDKVNEPALFVPQFIDKSRLMMELFSSSAVKDALALEIKSAMPNWSIVRRMTFNKIDELISMGITDVAASRRSIQKDIHLLHHFKHKGIRVYVYNVNHDRGKNEQYVICYDMNHIYGLYADNFVLNQQLQCNK
jgi:lipoteichoic acid synthase